MAQQAQHERDAAGFRQEGRDLLRAIAAGSIIGIPLLYTMEMWWRGMTTTPLFLLAILAGTLATNFLFGLFVGFRERHTWGEAVSESITAVAMGLLVSFLILLLLGVVRFDQAWDEIVGKCVVETAAVSLGVSFANAQVGRKSRQGDEQDSGGQEQSPEQRQFHQDLQDAGATLLGAVALSLSIAPTEEVILIAARLPAWQLLVVLAASIVLCYVILFASGFQDRKVFQPSLFQNRWMETAMCYAIALVVSAALLYLLGVPETTSHWSTFVACTTVLGLPAVVGGAAGRLIV